MAEPTVTIDIGNGAPVTAPLAAWVGALIVSLPPDLRAKVCRHAELATNSPRLPVVGGGAQVAVRSKLL